MRGEGLPFGNQERGAVCENAANLLSKSLLELRQQLKNQLDSIGEEILKALDRDPRRGARRLAKQLRHLRQDRLQENHRLTAMLRFEMPLWNQGIQLIAGVDEAGMAPLAGPVVAAAVILPKMYMLSGLNDSKKITSERKRKELAQRIKQDAICWATGRAEVEEIDKLNIYWAGILAMQRALSSLRVQPQYLLVDARTIPACSCPQHSIIHGDSLSASIAAASIIAKTERDEEMIAYDRIYPGYGFALHKGYPTADHLSALRSQGPLPIHRKSFAPVRVLLGDRPVQKNFSEVYGESK